MGAAYRGLAVLSAVFFHAPVRIRPLEEEPAEGVLAVRLPVSEKSKQKQAAFQEPEMQLVCLAVPVRNPVPAAASFRQ